MAARSPIAVRALLLVLVIASLGGLCVWYGTLGFDPAAHRYPTEVELGQDYDRFVGQDATVRGPVVATDPVVVDARPGPRLTVTELAADPTRGDRLVVFGVVEPDHKLRATNGFVVPTWRRWYTWLVSFVAGLWVLARLGRQWRLDRTDWTLVPREASDA